MWSNQPANCSALPDTSPILRTKKSGAIADLKVPARFVQSRQLGVVCGRGRYPTLSGPAGIACQVELGSVAEKCGMTR